MNDKKGVIHMGGEHPHKTKVFVYGSLKKGFGNHPYHLGKAHFVSTAVTLPQYSLFSLGAYPGVCKGGITQVEGEVYEVDKQELDSLDRLEGHPNYYKREVIETSEGDAWIYLLPQDKYNDHPVIESGVWEK